MSNEEPIYRVIFTQGSTTYEIYAKYVSEETMIGFVEAEELIFTEDKLLVDPVEEKLKNEFKDVERIYIPMHAIHRIDEVVKHGPARIHAIGNKEKGNVRHLPTRTSKGNGEDIK